MKKKIVNDNPMDYIEIPSVVSNSKEKVNHPTQKPVKLLEYLIKTYTNENELVLDNTMGSGSTGVACRNLNRNFIGIEKFDSILALALKKIDEDLFYRMNENNKEKEFIPSEKEIIISFPNVKLIINEKG